MEPKGELPSHERQADSIKVKIGREILKYTPAVIGAAAGVALVHAAPHLYEMSPLNAMLDPFNIRYAATHLVESSPIIANILGAGLGAISAYTAIDSVKNG